MRLALFAVALLLFATPVLPDDENKHVKELMAAIKGKENRPAGEVFKNVQMMKDVPAGRFLKIMDTGFNKALGTTCDHCHAEDRWEADEKRPKRAAREMMVLVNQINDSLQKLQDIDTSDATVNCTTCHRGYVKPATQMR
ncbi:MAG TPA: c-type cytochrome [Thermoanaerobaculia bacterium]|nr:c-type cytochrome [Thermoanaerobaculia bacterium]